MSDLNTYLDDLWSNDIRSNSQLSHAQRTTLIGYILRDYQNADAPEAMCDFNFTPMIEYLLACNLANPDMFDWIENIEDKRNKFLESVKTHLAKSMEDTIDMLFEEKEEEAYQDELDELPANERYYKTHPEVINGTDWRR